MTQAGRIRAARVLVPLAIATLALTLTGCGNLVSTKVSGMVGVALEQGEPVIVVLSCGELLDTVSASVDRSGVSNGQPNPVLGEWTIGEGKPGVTVLDPAAPTDGWEGNAMPWPKDRTVIISATAHGKDVAGRSVTVEPNALDGLHAGDVLIGDSGTTLTAQAFRARCQ